MFGKLGSGKRTNSYTNRQEKLCIGNTNCHRKRNNIRRSGVKAINNSSHTRPSEDMVHGQVYGGNN